MPTGFRKSEGLRIPPHSVDAETAVLGSLMLDKDAIFKIAGAIRANDFYKPVHQTIFHIMTELAERLEPIDIISVKSRLKERGELKVIGGMAYLTSLVNSVPSAVNVHHYAKIVNRKRIHRDLIQAAATIGELAYDEKRDVEKLLDEAEQKIFGVSHTSLQEKFLHVKEVLNEAWDRIERSHSSDNKYRGIPTGFIDLDEKLSGLQRSDLVVLAARPSLGKTSLALGIAQNIAFSGIPVGFFSLEMSKDQVVDRLIASASGVNLWQLRTGRLGDDDFTAIRNALDQLAKAPFFVDDVASPTIMQIRAMARRLQAEHKNLGLVVVDYLQLIKGPDAIESRVQEVSEISRSLKGLAKELNIPVLAISQLSRAVEMRQDAIPRLSDLRESGSIEQDADVVMFVYREDKVKKNSDRRNIAEILIEKHRNGPTGKIELLFDEDTVSFQSLAKNFNAEPF